MKPFIYCPHCKTTLIQETKDNEQVQRCTTCGFTYWNNPKPVVSIILVDQGKVLMLRRAHEPFQGFWVLPGGFVGYSETPQEAILRETKEETRLSPRVGKVIGVYRIDNDPRGIHIDIVYEGKPEGTLILSEEDSESHYFDPQELPEKIAYKHREAIADYIKSF